jgi:hypothetical protein
MSDGYSEHMGNLLSLPFFASPGQTTLSLQAQTVKDVKLVFRTTSCRPLHFVHKHYIKSHLDLVMGHERDFIEVCC